MSSELLAKARLLVYGQAMRGGRLVSRESVISPRAGFFRKLVVAPADRAARTETSRGVYRCDGQFKLSVLGQDVVMDSVKPRIIGTDPQADLPVNPSVLSPLLQTVLLAEQQLWIDAADGPPKLRNIGGQSVLVVRRDTEDRKNLTVHIVHGKTEAAYELNGGHLSVLEKTPSEESGNNSYRVRGFDLPEGRYSKKDIAQSADADALPLQPEDTIYVPLGRMKGLNKQLVWLEVQYEQRNKVILPLALHDLRRYQFWGLSAIKPAEDVPIERLTGNIRDLQAGQKTALLDLVPPEYRSNIVKMAQEAFPTMGRGRSYGDFEEAMALNWLLKMATFLWVVDKNAFQNRELVGREEKCQVLALTENGSVVAFGQPAERSSARQMHYLRIAERIVGTSVEEKHTEVLTKDIRLKDPLEIKSMITSPVIALAAGQSADPLVVKTASRVLSVSFTRINKATMMGPSALPPREKP